MSKRCLILGGGGFIGSAIVEQLLTESWSIRIFEHPSVIPFKILDDQSDVEWLQGDFQNRDTLAQALIGVDAVIHLISTMLPKRSNEAPALDVQTNVIATIQLLDAMVEAGVQRIIFASSGGTVYGIPKAIPITEEHVTNPEVSYGICKLMIEKYLYLYSKLHKIKPVILRIANPYGARQRIETAQGAVAAFLYRAVNSMPIEIWGDGTVTRDYLHVSDVANAFSRALQYDGCKIVFNISSGTGTSLNDLISLIEQITGKALNRTYSTARSFDVPVNILSNALARSELGWEPRKTLEDGLKATLTAIKH